MPTASALAAAPATRRRVIHCLGLRICVCSFTRLEHINTSQTAYWIWRGFVDRSCRTLSLRCEHMFVSLESLAQRRRELDAMEAAWLRAVGEYDRSDDWRAEGYASAANALRHVCN